VIKFAKNIANPNAAAQEFGRLHNLYKTAINNAVAGRAIDQNGALHIADAWEEYLKALGMPQDDLNWAMTGVRGWILANVP
jgi:hypothetical protein